MVTNKRTYGECPQLVELVRLMGSQAKVGDLLEIGRSSVSRYINENKAPSMVNQLAGFHVNDLTAEAAPAPVAAPVAPAPVAAPVAPAPPPPAATVAPPVEPVAPVDVAGFAYDPALHSTPPSQNNDGTWRKKRAATIPTPKRMLVLSFVPVEQYEIVTNILDGMGVEHFVINTKPE